MAVVTVDRRDAPARLALRDAASALRLAELREGVWMRPSNLEWGARDDLAVIGEQCTWLTATPEDPAAIAASLWDLDGWAADAKALVARMKRGRASLDRDSFDAIPEGFVTSAAVLRLLRADPLLPTALLPRTGRARRCEPAMTTTTSRCGDCCGSSSRRRATTLPREPHPDAARLGADLELPAGDAGVAQHLGGEHLGVDLLGHGQDDRALGDVAHHVA